MSLFTDLLPDVLRRDAGLLTGAASLLYTGAVAGAAFAALFSRRPDRRRTAQDVLALLLRRPERPGKPELDAREPGGSRRIQP